jgi:DNA-binding MarR family transcriptional regulator
VLPEYALGPAHHRDLHYVNRHPRLRVADLLDILKITKQSLARVLKELIDEGWIAQRPGQQDRRQRLLHTTVQGAALSARLDSLQERRVVQALAQAGKASDGTVASFLFAMISEEERARVQALLPQRVATAGDA